MAIEKDNEKQNKKSIKKSKATDKHECKCASGEGCCNKEKNAFIEAFDNIFCDNKKADKYDKLVDDWKKAQDAAQREEDKKDAEFDEFKKAIIELAEKYPEMFHHFLQMTAKSMAFVNTILEEDEDEDEDDELKVINLDFPLRHQYKGTDFVATVRGTTGNGYLDIEFNFSTETKNSYRVSTYCRSYKATAPASELFSDILEALEDHLGN